MLKVRLADATRLTVRYETKDENGETRRQRNSRFGAKSPEITPPPEAVHVWDWFWSELTGRRHSGPEPLTHAELDAWKRNTARLVRPQEIEMLIAMDEAFLSEMRKEQDAARERAMQKTGSNK